MPVDAPVTLQQLKQIPELAPYFQNNSDIVMDDRLFAHIHLSREVAGLPVYQGNSSEVTTRYAGHILRNFCKRSKDKSIWLDNLSGAAQDLLQASAEKEAFNHNRFNLDSYILKKLQKKSKILIPISWSSTEDARNGHEILMEIEKLNPQYYRIHIMNAGDGLQHHEKPESKRVYTIQRYAYLSQSDFKKTIEGLRKHWNSLDPDKFYGCLKSYSEPTSHAVDSSKQMLTGMCSWKMIMSLLKLRLRNKTAILRAKQELYTQSLVDYYQLFLKEKTPERAKLLTWGLNNYARFLYKKTKSLDQASVQAGLSLCQHIAYTLETKDWMPVIQEKVVEPHQLRVSLPDAHDFSATLKPTKSDAAISPGNAVLRYETEAELIGYFSSLDIRTLQDLSHAVFDIDCRLLSNIYKNSESIILYKEKLHEHLLSLPSMATLPIPESGKTILEYIKNISDLQEHYTGFYKQTKNADDVKNNTIDPEYVLCSARFCVEMLTAFFAYFQKLEEKNIAYPVIFSQQIDYWIKILQHIQFHAIKPNLQPIWSKCLEDLKRLACKNYASYGDVRSQYDNFRFGFLDALYHLDEETLLKRTDEYLQTTARDPSRPVSEDNPINANKLIFKSSGIATHDSSWIHIQAPLRITSAGQLNTDQYYISNIKNPLVFLKKNLLQVIPECSEAASLCDVAFHFMNVLNGSADVDVKNRTKLYPSPIRYDIKNNSAGRSHLVQNAKDDDSLFAVDLESLPSVLYCHTHKKEASQCTEKDKDTREEKQDQIPCNIARGHCYAHSKSSINCTDADRKPTTVKKDYNPCGRAEKVYQTNAFHCQYQPIPDFFEVSHHEVLNFNPLPIHPKLNITQHHPLGVSADKAEVRRILQEQDLIECENRIRISSAMHVPESRIESLLQYYRRDFRKLRDPSERDKLLTVLLYPGALEALVKNNANLVEFLNHFLEDYRLYLSTLNGKKTVEKYFCDGLATLLYHRLPDGMKSAFEPTYQLGKEGDYGMLMDLYHRCLLDDKTELESMFAHYCRVLYTYGLSPHEKGKIEERMLFRLQGYMYDIYYTLNRQGKRADLVLQMNQMLRTLPGYESIHIDDLGFESAGENQQSIRHLILQGGRKYYRFDMKTGQMEEGGLKNIPTPDELRRKFPDLLQGIDVVRYQNNRYYFGAYCIENTDRNTYALYQKFETSEKKDRWFQKIQQSDVNLSNFSNQLKATVNGQDKYDYWCAYQAENKGYLYLVNKKTKKIEYQLQQEAQDRWDLYKSVDGAMVRLGGPGSCAAEDFESALLSEFSVDHGDFIEFPRYGFSLKRKGTDLDGRGRYSWSKNPHYHWCQLDKTELGDFKHYIGLVSESGKKKMLIPCQSYFLNSETKTVQFDTFGLIASEKDLSSPRAGTLAQRGNYVYHQPNSQHYIECEVDAQGKLLAKHLPDKFYFIYLLLGQANYDRAFEVFREIEQSGYFSLDNDVLQHFRKLMNPAIIFTTKNIYSKRAIEDHALRNGKKAAIQLKCFIHLLKMHLGSPSQALTEFLDEALAVNQLALFSEYVENIHNIPKDMQLSKQELVALSDWINGNAFARNLDCDSNIAACLSLIQDSEKTDVRRASCVVWSSISAQLPSNHIESLWATLYPQDRLNHFRAETARQLNDIKHPGPTLLDQMVWDDEYGAKLQVRNRDFSKLCADEFLQLTNLEEKKNEYLHKIDDEIDKSQQALFDLVSRYETKTGSNTIQHIARLLGRERIKTDFPAPLMQLFIQHDFEAYRRQLGPLTDQEIERLDAQIANILRLITDRRYAIKLFSTIEKAKTNHETERLSAILEEGRSYQMDDPAARYFLAYEYLSDILIRPIQMKMLRPLLQKVSGKKGKSYQNEVFQLIMGGGKSKVLMPLSSFLKADGKSLATVVVPESLFETNLRDLSRYSIQNFNQKAVPLQFHRTDAQDHNALVNIRNMLYQTVKDMNYIVTTKTTLQSIELSYLSLLSSNIVDSNKLQRIQLLEEILQFFENKSDVFIDEIDSNLNCFDALNYTLEYKHYPPEYLVDLQVRFFDFIRKDEALYQALMAPNVTLDQGKFYALFADLIDKMADDPESILGEGLAPLSDVHRRSVKRYLKSFHEASTIPEGFSDYPLSTKRIIGFCRSQFNYILPLILSKIENVHYGLTHNADQEDLVDQCVAIPYAGNNNPRETSRFANLYEIFGYTTLIHLQNGFPKACLESYLKIFTDAYEEQTNIEAKTFLVTKLYEELGLDRKQCPLEKLIDPTPEFLEALWLDVKDKPSVILLMLKKLILNKIKLYPFMLESTSSDFTGMFHSVQGASGTIDNPGILDPGIHFDRSISPGTDGKTIAILKEKALDDILFADSKDGDVYLRELSKNTPDFDRYQAIIDVGAHFAGVPNLAVAQGIARFYRQRQSTFKHILYFNKENILCALSVDKEETVELGSSDASIIREKLGCGPEDYFVYFDQVHTIGTDIPLAKGPLGANVLTTFSPKTTQQALLQGVMRARDLAYTQNTAFVGNTELKRYLALKDKPANKASLLYLARENLLAQIHEGAFRAAKQKLKAIYRRAALKKIQLTNSMQKQQVLKNFEQIIFSEIELDPSKLFIGNQSIQETQAILYSLAKDLHRKYGDALGDLRSETNSVIRHCIQYCQKQTLQTDYQGAQAEVEVMSEQETELQTNLEAQRENELQRVTLQSTYQLRAYQDLNWASIINDVSSKHFVPDLTQEPSLMSRLESLSIPKNTYFFSKNILPTEESGSFFHHNLTCYYVLWIQYPTHRSLIAISNTDKKFVQNFLQDTTELKAKVCLRAMSGEWIAGDKIEEDEDWQKHMDAMRFLSGNLATNNRWLKNKKTSERLAFYRQYIAPYHRDTESALQFLEKQQIQEKGNAKRLLSQEEVRKIEKPWKNATINSIGLKSISGYPNILENMRFFPKLAEQTQCDKEAYGYFAVRGWAYYLPYVPIIGLVPALIGSLCLLARSWYRNIKANRVLKSVGMSSLSEQVGYQGTVVSHPIPQYRGIKILFSALLYLLRGLSFLLSGFWIYQAAALRDANALAKLEQCQATTLRLRELQAEQKMPHYAFQPIPPAPPVIAREIPTAPSPESTPSHSPKSSPRMSPTP